MTGDLMIRKHFNKLILIFHNMTHLKSLNHLKAGELSKLVDAPQHLDGISVKRKMQCYLFQYENLVGE